MMVFNKSGLMTEFLTASGISREVEQQYGVEVPPKLISDLLYQRKVDVHTCPVVAGRRFVPRSLLPEILRALRERGLTIPETLEE
jgi:hypothetical protein